MKTLKIRALVELDECKVERLDALSGNDVADWLYDENSAWGAFLNEELVGYCTIGDACIGDEEIENHPAYSFDSLLLSDVYILPEYRGRKYASQLIETAIEGRRESNETVFLTVLSLELGRLYKPLGFTFIEDELMVRVG